MTDRNFDKGKASFDLVGIFRKPEDRFTDLLQKKLEISKRLGAARVKSCYMKKAKQNYDDEMVTFRFNDPEYCRYNPDIEPHDYSRREIMEADQAVDKLIQDWLDIDKKINDIRSRIKTDEIKKIETNSEAKVLIDSNKNFDLLFEYVGLKRFYDVISHSITLIKPYVKNNDMKEKLNKKSFRISVGENYDLFLKMRFEDKIEKLNNLDNIHDIIEFLYMELISVNSSLKKLNTDKKIRNKVENMIPTFDKIPLNDEEKNEIIKREIEFLKNALQRK